MNKKAASLEKKNIIIYFLVVILTVTLLLPSCSNTPEYNPSHNLISASETHVAAVSADGRVVAIGENLCGECDTEDWRDVVSVYAAPFATIGLKNDGTVVMVGSLINGLTMPDGTLVEYTILVDGWEDDFKNIVTLSAASYSVGFLDVYPRIIGLKDDGTCVIAESVSSPAYDDAKEKISKWESIIAVGAYFNGYYGVTKRGDLVILDYNGKESVTEQTICSVGNIQAFYYQPGSLGSGIGQLLLTSNNRLLIIIGNIQNKKALEFKKYIAQYFKDKDDLSAALSEFKNISDIGWHDNSFVCLNTKGKVYIYRSYT